MYTKNLMTLSSVPLEIIHNLWEQNDVLIFFIDLDDYDFPGLNCLSNIEREYFEKLQTSYFKKRYLVSRMVLKHVLCLLLNISSIQEISTFKDDFGKVRILNHKELHVCISYSENIITLAVSRVKVGIDVEIERSLTLKNSLKYFKQKSPFTENVGRDAEILMIWTLKEAYCKFSNKTMFSILSKEPEFNNLCCSSYVLDGKYIFSVITGSDLHPICINRLENINFYRGLNS